MKKDTSLELLRILKSCVIVLICHAQKTCFCCGHKFKPEDFISLAVFDKGMGNKFLCEKCKNVALKDLGDKNTYLDINR